MTDRRPIESVGRSKKASLRLLPGISVLLVALAVNTPEAMAAKSFEKLAEKAVRVESMERIIGPFLQVCGRTGSVEHLQCRAIRSRMQRSVKRGTYIYTADAVEVGAYNGQALNYPVRVLGCLSKEPFKLSFGLYGNRNDWYVTTKAPRKLVSKGNKTELEGIELDEHLPAKAQFLTIPVGPSDTESWERSTKVNLRVQFVFRLTGEKWPKALAKPGLLVTLLGYRLFNQCDGKVLASYPPSKSSAPVAVNPTCGGRAVAVVAPTRKVLPDTLETDTVRQVMRSANDAVQECYNSYQIQGLARVKVTVISDGTVKAVQIKGKFNNTPTGKCIREKVMNLLFPRFKKSQVAFTYPFYLR